MSMAILMKGLLLVFLCIALAESSYAQRSSEEMSGIEKKYYLKDCMVKLNLQWNPAMTALVRERVVHAINVQISKAIVSGEFPLFVDHTTWERRYYIFYYIDQCEDRRQLVETLVEKYLVPHIPEFPEYQIEDEDLQPGFDGSGPPQCCWLDSKKREG